MGYGGTILIPRSPHGEIKHVLQTELSVALNEVVNRNDSPATRISTYVKIEKIFLIEEDLIWLRFTHGLYIILVFFKTLSV
jgi:hypothetical protein